MSGADDLTSLKRRLCDVADQLAIDLFGDPIRRTTRELRFGRKGSLRVRLGRIASFYSFEADSGGSMLDAIMFAHGCSFPEAVKFARDWLGDDGTKPRRRVRRKLVPVFDDEPARIEKARRMWAAGRKVEGTLAGAYLGRRRLVADFPDTVARFIEARVVQQAMGWTWWRWSAVIFAATTATGELRAVQLVALLDDGTAAPHWEDATRKIKLSVGVLRDVAVRFPGAGDGPLLLAEGPETAASCWQATGFETWANLGSIAKAPLDDAPRSRKVVVCADDDQRNAPSNKAVNEAVRKWQLDGRKVFKVKPWPLTRRDKSDFNDLLQAEGDEAVRARIYSMLAPPATPAPAPSVFDARKHLARAVSNTVADLLAWRPLDETTPAPFKVIRATLGLGKTREAIARIIEAVAAGRRVAIAVPRHKLGGELDGRIIETVRCIIASCGPLNLTVKTWRGRGADDPENAGEKMCRNLDLVEKARRVFADVKATVCKVCPYKATCSYIEQDKARANIWIVAHDLLFFGAPAALEIMGVSLLVIDEDFAHKGLAGLSDTHKKLVTVEQLDTMPEDGSGHASDTADMHAKLMPLRRKLRAVIEAHGLGGLSRASLIAAGLTIEDARSAQALEWQAKITIKVDATTTPASLRDKFKAAASNAAIVPLVMLWQAVEDLLRDDGATASGRAVLVEQIDDATGAKYRAVRVFRADPINADWRRVPTLYIDATVDLPLLQTRVPGAELVADIAAAMPHVRVEQHYGRAFGHRALFEWQGKGEVAATKLLAKVWAWSVARITRAGGRGLVVLPKQAEQIILADPITYPRPAFVEVGHFNGLRGIDEFRDVRTIIVIGRPMPKPEAVELQAGVLTGRQVAPLSGWYPAVAVTLHGLDGTAGPVEADRHPDEMAERVRRAICEAELVQVIGRGRGVGRTAGDPLDVILLGNVPVEGLVADTVQPWDEPGHNDKMLATFGAVLSSAGDMAEVAGVSRKAVKSARERLASRPYERFLYGPGANLATAVYQRSGAGRAEQRIEYDPRRIPDIGAWLVERLGPVEVIDDGVPADIPTAIENRAYQPPADVAAHPENLIFKGGNQCADNALAPSEAPIVVGNPAPAPDLDGAASQPASQLRNNVIFQLPMGHTWAPVAVAKMAPGAASPGRRKYVKPWFGPIYGGGSAEMPRPNFAVR